MCVLNVFCVINVIYVTFQSSILKKQCIKVKKISFHSSLQATKALFCFACGRKGVGVFAITLNFLHVACNLERAKRMGKYTEWEHVHLSTNGNTSCSGRTIRWAEHVAHMEI